jgi:DNA-binding NtrC family response regulator
VLVVDDEPSVRHVLRSYLTAKGCEVEVADSAEQALELLPDTLPEVALVDIVLPGMDGLHLLGELQEKSPDTQVVLITSHGSAKSAVTAVQRGAYEYLEKPFKKLDDVWSTVQGAAQKRTLSLQMRDLLKAHRRAESAHAVDRETDEATVPDPDKIPVPKLDS